MDSPCSAVIDCLEMCARNRLLQQPFEKCTKFNIDDDLSCESGREFSFCPYFIFQEAASERFAFLLRLPKKFLVVFLRNLQIAIGLILRLHLVAQDRDEQLYGHVPTNDLLKTI